MKNKIHHFQELSDEALERVTGGVGGTSSCGAECVCSDSYVSKSDCPSGYPNFGTGICCSGPLPQTREHILL